MNWPLLLGDVEDVIKIVLVILFVVFPLIGQIIKGARGEQPAGKPRPRPAQAARPQAARPQAARPQAARPQAARPQAARPQANVQGDAPDALRGEIDDFLQRAARRRGAGPVQEVEILQPELIEPVEPRRLVEAIEPQASPLESTVEAAGRPIQSETLGTHAEQLGSQVGLADEKAESHLHQVFDHQLGTLADTSQQSPSDDKIAEGTDSSVWESTVSRRQRQKESSDERAQQIASMLRDPSDLKEAIILSEIIRRPVDFF